MSGGDANDDIPFGGDDRAAGDARRDPFAPPAIPTEVGCMHCGECYESWQIEWRPRAGGPGADPDDAGDGDWCCPTPGCDGVGFCFDIWPTDPEWRDEYGERVTWVDDGEDDEDEDRAAWGRDWTPEDDEEDAEAWEGESWAEESEEEQPYDAAMDWASRGPQSLDDDWATDEWDDPLDPTTDDCDVRSRRDDPGGGSDTFDEDDIPF